MAEQKDVLREAQSREKFKTMIGGQALIEGILMQGPEKRAIVVRSPEGEISIDLRGKAPGRGAYLCPSAACLAKARKAKRLERTFEVPIPDGIYDRLTEEIACAEQSAKEAASHE